MTTKTRWIPLWICGRPYPNQVSLELFNTVLIDYDPGMVRYATKWISNYNLDFDLQEYVQGFKNISKYVSSTKLRDFQYRLLLYKIPLNCDLKQWGLINSDLCSFCQEDVEDFQHLFFDCQYTKEVWDTLEVSYDMPPLGFN